MKCQEILEFGSMCQKNPEALLAGVYEEDVFLPGQLVVEEVDQEVNQEGVPVVVLASEENVTPT